MRRSTLLVVVSTALSVLTVASGSPTGNASLRPAFHPMPCPAGTFPPRLHVDCGFVRVPENRADPNDRSITVAAAVIRTQSSEPRHDPIVFVDGGPSFGAINGFGPQYYFDKHATYAADRDVILVDPRGTGLSKPRLGCPEFDRANVQAFYSGRIIDGGSVPIYRRAIAHCRDRFAARGIDLAAYNSEESAADLDDLRRALGIHRWNLLAISADGVLGLTYMRLYPNSIRSAVLDSAQSTQMLWFLDFDRGYAGMLDRIFAGCAADAACHDRYPGLRHAFMRRVRALQAHPLTITLPDLRPRPATLRLDGAGLYADTIYNIFPGDKDFPSEIPGLLNLMWREAHGNLVRIYRRLVGTGPITNDHENDFLAGAKTMSYVCHDVLDFVTRADRVQAAQDVPPFASRYLNRNYDITGGFAAPVSPAGCRIWGVGRADAAQHEPVTTKVPTLVLAGEYDSGVPANVVRQTTVGLSRFHYYEFPASAHLQLASYTHGSVCARAIATQFLASPHADPDASCIADVAPVDFTP